MKKKLEVKWPEEANLLWPTGETTETSPPQWLRLSVDDAQKLISDLTEAIDKSEAVKLKSKERIVSDKRYTLNLPSNCVVDGVTWLKPNLADVAAIEAECKRLREEAEAEAEADKPKAWDFGLDGDSNVRISGRSVWADAKDPLCGWVEHKSLPVCILGNLREIVKQGEIVVGFTVDEAKHIERSYSRSLFQPAIHEKTLRALVCYEKTKP